MSRREDDDFDAFMRHHGVVPIGKAAAKGRGAAKAATPAARSPAAPAHASGSTSATAPRQAQPAPAAATSDHSAELTTLRQAHAAQAKELEAARRAAAKAAEQAVLDRQARDAVEAQALAQQTELLTLRTERTALDSERRKAARRLGDIERNHAEVSRRLSDADKHQLLLARGLRSADEQVAALRCLLDATGTAAVDALCDADPRALMALLERLVRCCDDAGCQPSPDTPALRVAKASCEICGGSDIRRTFVVFAAACRQAGFDRVTLVGGSPAYRETLRGLARELGHGLQLQVVQHERPGEAKRAQAVRGLVVIWGATAVDHTTTGHYRNAGDAQIAVNHRGVAGMLAQVSERLAARAGS